MIQASPSIQGLAPLQSAGRSCIPVKIWLTGMRWLAEYRAAGDDDGEALWGDVPTSHGLYTPLVFAPRSGELLGNTALDWWVTPLRDLFRKPRVSGSTVKVERRRVCSRLVFLNTLDNVFGHSLLLLLNAQHYLDRHPECGLVVIGSPDLRPYLPEGIAEVWELQAPRSETLRWHQSLSDLFAARCRECSCFVATAVSHPGPTRYDLRRFHLAPTVTPPRPEVPQILFIYRGSRLWGGSFASERERLQRLARWLRAMWPSVRLNVFGHAALPQPVAGWNDCTRRGESDYDARLIAALQTADLVLGAHGSSLLLPTAMARLVLELVPLDKQASLLQDCLFDAARGGIREQFWRLRFLYGNGTLNDIYPRQVAQLINAMISMHGHFTLYQSTAWDDPEASPTGRADRFAQEVAPKLAGWQERLNQTTRLPWSTRWWQWLRRWSAEND